MSLTSPKYRTAFAALTAASVALVLMAGGLFASNDDPTRLSQLAPPSPPFEKSAAGEISVRVPRPGLSGSIVSVPEAMDLDGDGFVEVAFGTTSGFFIVGKDGIEQHIGPLAPVSDFTKVADINNDGTDDFVIAVSDTLFPNIRAYDTVTGEEIWSYRPAQTTFSNNLMWTEQQTLTFDLLTVDLGGNLVEEVLATSGYRLYALDATTGDMQWQFEWSDNLWKSASVADFTGDGNRDVLVGSQDGYLFGIDGSNGEELWRTHIAPDYKAFDEQGSPWKNIPQGIWDIVPVLNGEKAIITSEDGHIRLVSVTDGTVFWDHEYITRIDAVISTYYSRKNGLPTGPNDTHFFNLRAQVVPDATKDGRDNLLVTSYLGAGQMEDPRQATLSIMDIATGGQVWKKQVASIAGSKRLAIFENDDEHYVVVPGSDHVALKLADGNSADPTLLKTFGLSDESRNGDGQDSGYSLISLNPNGSVVMSDNGDFRWSESGSNWTTPHTVRSHLLRVDLVGNDVPDVLVILGSGSSTNFGTEPRERLIYVLDGSTGKLAWEYEPSDHLIDATGGLAGVTVGPDFDGDGRPDLIAYAQDASEFQGRELDAPGESSRVIVVSGADGSEILVAPAAKGTYYGIWDDVYSSEGTFEEMLRSELVKIRTVELEEHWVREELENRMNQFRSESDDRWNSFIGRSMEERSADLDAGIGDGHYVSAERQAQMDEWWLQLEDEITQNLENTVQYESEILRSLEVDESKISAYEATRRESFDDQLEDQRVASYEQWGNEYEGPTYNREEVLGEYENELQNQRESVEQEFLDEYLILLDSEKKDWMTESLGNVDNEVAEQVDQWTQNSEEQQNWRRIDKRIVSVSPIKFPGTEKEYGLFLSTGNGISVMDISGDVIWERTQNPDVYSTPLGNVDVEKYGIGIEYESHRPVRVIGDINGDGIDDLRFMARGSLFFATSYVNDGEINYRAGDRISGPAEDGGDGDAAETDDLDGDGVRDVALYRWIENAPPEMQIFSGADGSKLLEIDGLDPNSSSLKLSSDFNDDGSLDLILFQRWVEGAEGPRVSILDGQSGNQIWVYNELDESQILDQMGLETGLSPITPIGDLTGDGIDEVAIVRHLTYQPGGSLVVIDITTDEIVKEIFTEPKDSERGLNEERWHPGLLVADVGDLNNDGSPEIAVVNAFGESQETKQYRLVVMDLEAESVLADFRTIGTKLVPLDEAGLLGLVGLGGEIYTLNVSSELVLTAPTEFIDGSEPVMISWSGATDDSFNQVIVDDLVVARTNDDSVELNLAAGEHSITVRSIDQSGRGIRATAVTTVSKSSSTFMLLYVFAFGAVLLTLVLPSLRWWSRRSLKVGKS